MNRHAIPVVYWRVSPHVMAWIVDCAIRQNLRHVRLVSCFYEPGSGALTVCVRPRWYCYLGIGAMHFWIYKNAKMIVDLLNDCWLDVRLRVL